MILNIEDIEKMLLQMILDIEKILLYIYISHCKCSSFLNYNDVLANDPHCNNILQMILDIEKMLLQTILIPRNRRHGKNVIANDPYS